MMTAG